MGQNCAGTSTDYVFHTVIGTVTLAPLGSAYIGQGLQVTQEGSNFGKSTIDAIRTSNGELVLMEGEGGLHVVVHSEPISNTCFVTSEIGLVTQSSVHVNKRHGRGMMCPYS